MNLPLFSDVLILQAFWVFLPAGVANMAPPLANKIPLLNKWKTPLDLGKSYNGVRIFGDNKTWRGLVFGMVLAAVTLLVEMSLVASPATDYTAAFSLLAGALLGFGALLGDAVESFFKRRSGVKPGHSWFPFDQTDYIVGGLVVMLLMGGLTFNIVGLIFVIYFGLHLVVSYLGFLLGFKPKPI